MHFIYFIRNALTLLFYLRRSVSSCIWFLLPRESIHVAFPCDNNIFDILVKTIYYHFKIITQVPCNVIIRCYSDSSPTGTSCSSAVFRNHNSCIAVMAAYDSAGFGTVPLFFFSFQKRLHSVFFDEFQNFHHIQIILSSVALVEPLQAAAGEIAELLAKADKAFPNQFTMMFYK